MVSLLKNCLQWIELSESALRHNVFLVSSFCKSRVVLGALLKANAYGHGLLPMAELYQRCGVSLFLVHSFQEAWTLRKNGFRERLLLIGPQSEEELAYSLKQDFEITVYNEETLRALHRFQKKIKKTARLHVKIETGTYRQGLDPKIIPSFIALLKTVKHELKGFSSHFANIEDTSDTTYYQKQMSIFKKSVQTFEKQGFRAEALHIACSAAVLLYPETQLDIVRPGIALYGYASSPELAYALKLPEPLKPVLSWRTRLCQIKSVPEGHSVGYGLTFKTTRNTRLGILPIGYYDGFDRRLSNLGFALVHGKRAPILGRVCMNLTMLDLTDISEAALNDTVTLIGTDGAETITADHLASSVNTIAYEILARLNPLIPRIIVL